MLTTLKILSLVCKSVFYRPEHNAIYIKDKAKKVDKRMGLFF